MMKQWMVWWLALGLGYCGQIYGESSNEAMQLDSDLKLVTQKLAEVNEKISSTQDKLSYLLKEQKNQRVQVMKYYENREALIEIFAGYIKKNLEANVTIQDEAQVSLRIGSPEMKLPSVLPIDRNCIPLGLMSINAPKGNELRMLPYTDKQVMEFNKDVQGDYFVLVDFSDEPLLADFDFFEADLYAGRQVIDYIGIVVLKPTSHEETNISYKVRQFESYKPEEVQTDGEKGFFKMDFREFGTIEGRKGDRWGIVLKRNVKLPCDYVVTDILPEYNDLRVLPFDTEDAMNDMAKVYDFSDTLKNVEKAPLTVQKLENGKEILPGILPGLRPVISFGLTGTPKKQAK